MPSLSTSKHVLIKSCTKTRCYARGQVRCCIYIRLMRRNMEQKAAACTKKRDDNGLTVFISKGVRWLGHCLGKSKKNRPPSTGLGARWRVCIWVQNYDFHSATHGCVCVISSAFWKIGPSIIRSTWLPSELSLHMITRLQIHTLHNLWRGADNVSYFLPHWQLLLLGEHYTFIHERRRRRRFVSLLAACMRTHSPNYQTHINNGPHPYMMCWWMRTTCAPLSRFIVIYLNL